MQDLIIAALQLDLAWEDPASNREKCANKIAELSTVDLILLPEMFTTGFSMNPETLAETMDGETVSWMRAQAGKKNAVVAGSLSIEDAGSFYNRMLWMHPDGSYETYDKVHLIGLTGEDRAFTAGTERKIFEVCGWKVLPQICYDLRFPVWSRNIDDYDLMINVANWPKVRAPHWQVLTTARAIENQVYVVAVNRVGTDGNKLEYQGDTLVIAPDGEIVASMRDAEQTIVTTLSFDRLRETRTELPFLADRDTFKID